MQSPESLSCRGLPAVTCWLDGSLSVLPASELGQDLTLLWALNPGRSLAPRLGPLDQVPGQPAAGYPSAASDALRSGTLLGTDKKAKVMS